MICYLDRTFCPFFGICKAGHNCDRALTKKVIDDATAWWGKDNPPICVYAEFPECFVRFFEEV